jgi:hypothetical protein
MRRLSMVAITSALVALSSAVIAWYGTSALTQL